MRARFVLPLITPLLFGLAACGADSATAPQPQPKAAIAFKIDAATCNGLGTVTLDYFIDGSHVGTGNLAPGEQSSDYAVDPGPHVTLVQVSNSTYGWGNANMTVESGQRLTRLLSC